MQSTDKCSIEVIGGKRKAMSMVFMKVPIRELGGVIDVAIIVLKEEIPTLL